MLTCPMNTGRNWTSCCAYRVPASLTARYKPGTPVCWRSGEDVVILQAMPDAVAKRKFPNGWKAVKPLLRVVAQPWIERFGAGTRGTAP